MLIHGSPRVAGNRLELDADAFIYDPSFPNAPFWKKASPRGFAGRPGCSNAPSAAKLSTAEIWDAITEKPSQASQHDQHRPARPRFFFTPHQVSYTLSPKTAAPTVRARRQRSRWAAASSTRSRSATISSPLTIPPHSGHPHELLDVPERSTSWCSIKARVIFGIHTPARCCSIRSRLSARTSCSRSTTPATSPVVNPVVLRRNFSARPEYNDPEFKNPREETHPPPRHRDRSLQVPRQ